MKLCRSYIKWETDRFNGFWTHLIRCLISSLAQFTPRSYYKWSFQLTVSESTAVSFHPFSTNFLLQKKKRHWNLRIFFIALMSSNKNLLSSSKIMSTFRGESNGLILSRFWKRFPLHILSFSAFFFLVSVTTRYFTANFHVNYNTEILFYLMCGIHTLKLTAPKRYVRIYLTYKAPKKTNLKIDRSFFYTNLATSASYYVLYVLQ